MFQTDIFSLQQLSWQTTPTTGKNQPLALVFMVHICQISLITLSVRSHYLFLYICIEYHTHLCQTIRRGRGESDHQFPMEIFVFFGFIHERQTGAGAGSGKDRPGWTLCSGFSPVVLPDAKPSSTTKFSSSFPAVPGCGCSPRALWSHTGADCRSISNTHQEFPSTCRGFSFRTTPISTPLPGLQNPITLGPERQQNRARGAPCSADPGTDHPRGSLLVFVLPGTPRDAVQRFLLETSNVLYMKLKFHAVVDGLLNHPGISSCGIWTGSSHCAIQLV